MAVTRETLALLRQLRIDVSDLVDADTRYLVAGWARAFDAIYPALVDAVDDLLLAGAGRWPHRSEVYASSRAQQAIALVRGQLGELARVTGVTVTDSAGRAVDLGAQAQPRLIVSQLPPSVVGPHTDLRFDRVSREALEAIVRRSGEQITALTWPISDNATAAIQQALVRGVAVGDNPRVAAQRMLRTVEGDFNGGLTRALNIARTETLDAHRAGSMAQQQANTEVLGEWVWMSALDERTCASCFAMHGSTFPLDTPGPIDHQSGRCTRLPITKSWADLGFDIEEPPSLIPDAQETFAALPPAAQERIMGPGRLDALNSGRVQWADLPQLRTTSGWRDSYGVKPLRDLLATG